MVDPETSLQIGRLKCRADFVRAGKGKRWHGKALSLQAGRAEEQGGARVGFTLTKKVGCAVIRNRARRRLREAVRLASDLPVVAGHDYVIIGRIDAIRMPFGDLKSELDRAFRAVHTESTRRSEGTRPRRPRPKP